MKRARRSLAAVIGVVVLAGGGGWYAGQHVRSPAEAAAARRPPPASLITVPVESRILTNGVVARGTIAYESPRPVALSGAVAAPPVAGTAAGSGEGGSQKVTRAPVAGDRVTEGSLLMEVSGRPVLVLRGTVPMYRTLGPGAKGADVRQLNEGLERVGFPPGGAGDTFTPGTAAALRKWYGARGYDPKEPGAAERRQLAALEQAVQAATEAVTTAKAELDVALDPPAPAPAPDAATSTTAAPDAASTRTTGKGGGTPSPDVPALRQRVTNAEKSLGYARQDLADFQAGYGTSVPAGELVFLPELPVRVDQVGVRPGDTPSGQVATVTGTAVGVQATVPAADARLLRPGMPAILELDSGERLAGKVEAVGQGAEVQGTEVQGTEVQGPGQQGVGQQGTDATRASGNAGGTGGTGGSGNTGGNTGGGSPGGATGVTSAGTPAAVRVLPDDPAALASRAGASVKVTVEVGSTVTPVLAVPIAAVFTGADGQARVKVERADGTVTPVAVRLGLAAAGFVAVTVADARSLLTGDRVVVGET